MTTKIEEHALTIAKLAETLSMQYFRQPLQIDFKSDESPVTHADRAIETAVRDYIRQHFPDHGVFGEEHGVEGRDCRNLWVIDPIDGTRSFLSGHPLFGFLLAHLRDGQTDLGVIGMPALGEIYIGQAGQGATLNGAPIAVSGQTRPDHAILFVNEAEKILHDHPQVFSRLTRTGQTRRFGYDCYPHALLASGHVDVVVDYDLQPYDFLAVSAVAMAAGGRVTDWAGNPLTRESSGDVLSAATPELHDAMLEVLNG